MIVTLVGQGSQQHGMQKRQFDGLGEELFGPILNGANGSIRGTLTNQRDYRDAGLHALDAMQKLNCVAIRQGEVKDGSIRTELLDLQLGFPSIWRFGDQLAVRHEKVADSRPYNGVNVDDENSISAQALTCGHKSCSRVLVCEEPRSSWEQ